MARPSLFTHRKFRTLARRIGSRALAVGSLELLWAVANDAGDPLIGSAEDVEDVADWQGERGQLVDALVATRFLDETPDGYVIHDHDHHCPTYVRRRRDRERARRATDVPVTRQRRVTGVPVDTTPNSHHPSPHTHHPCTPPDADASAAPRVVRAEPDEPGEEKSTPPQPTPFRVLDDYWQAWRTAAATAGTDIRLGASATEREHLRELAAAYTVEDFATACQVFWASRYLPSRALGLLRSLMADLLAHASSGSRRAFRAPGDRRDEAKPAPAHTPWTCPHDEPRCTGRWRCEQRTALEAAKAEAS